MELLIVVVLIIVSIVLLGIILGFNFKKAKSLQEDKTLEKLINKFPDNITVAKEMLKSLNNEKVKVEETKSNNTSLYIAITDKILIANIKNNYSRIQTIAHECLHSIQDRKILLFNFIFSNISMVYWVVIAILTLTHTIKNIEIDDVNDYVWFTVEINEIVRNYFEIYTDIELIEYTEDNRTVVRFFVKKFKDTNEDDEDYQNIIPFNLAYAVSIHKAQGLEYESVKIIITSNIEDNITKNIFYTAITRTKKNLTIFWSPESQKKIFENFKIKTNSRDISILKTKI